MPSSSVHLRGKSGKLFAQLDKRLQAVANEAALAGCGFTVTTGYRSDADQLKAFKAGLSRAKPGQSPHNKTPARAFDFIPFPFTGWEGAAALEQFRVRARMFLAAGRKIGIPVIWGRDWDGDGDETDQTLMDAPHIELKGWKDL
jgi:peptidoglycan L-alanyl-D-glutamate endopeptidase CwlK